MTQISRSELLEKVKKRVLTSLPQGHSQKIAFISVGFPNKRAFVWQTRHENPNRIWTKIERHIDRYYNVSPWIKIDVVDSIHTMSYEELKQQFESMERNNYFRYGIAFDDRFEVAFLEQEINANAILKPGPNYRISQLGNVELQFDFNNLNKYIFEKYKKPLFLKEERLHSQPVHVFTTKSFLIEESSTLIDLQKRELYNGIRFINSKNEKKLLTHIVKDGGNFLANQILHDGKFVYGYFPCYDHTLTSYNTIRHFSSLYALLEVVEYTQDFSFIKKIKTSIDWGINNLSTLVEDQLFFVEQNSGEIKLGAQGMALLTLSKYMTITDSREYQEYGLQIVSAMERMIDHEGNTVHVLDAETLEIKEEFRTVYYDGEAVFGLLRLYTLIKEEHILEIAKRIFNCLIEKEYWKYHDHWLSYATNEITYYINDIDYYEFGIRNAFEHLTFIDKRETAYPTLLELMNSAHLLIEKCKIEHPELLEKYDVEKFEKIRTKRARHELTGVFLPEVAMYFKNPQRILYGFYSRHDRFRTRIDDAEHFLSGFINYLKNPCS
ncbi:hypothetical protein [Bacillus cereus]|uniref:Poly(Glycerol-phosphate) alpha-glucosyltransferase n=1 Tax=Bacillus cereus TaxID=1396 RepID=A0A2A7HSH3_BACCE|nr:hypothetical protein [Bacillus cereus]PEC19907.1 hypothetical protein COM96_22195 [Bacillus cereus]